jgi:hypothetical protein
MKNLLGKLAGTSLALMLALPVAQAKNTVMNTTGMNAN